MYREDCPHMGQRPTRLGLIQKELSKKQKCMRLAFEAINGALLYNVSALAS
jgi:hypothetical protein